MAGESVGTPVADEVGCVGTLAGLASFYTSPAALAWSAMFATDSSPAAAGLAASGPALRLLAQAQLVLAARTRVAWDAWGNPASPQRRVSGGRRLARVSALLLEIGAGVLAARAGLQILIPGLVACLAIPVLVVWVITATRGQQDQATVPVRFSPEGRSAWRRISVVLRLPWLVGLAAGLGLERTELALVAVFAILAPLTLVVWPLRDPEPGEADGTEGPPHPARFDFVGAIDRDAADRQARLMACALRREAPTFDEAIGVAPASAWSDVFSEVGARYRARTRRDPSRGGVGPLHLRGGPAWPRASGTRVAGAVRARAAAVAPRARGRAQPVARRLRRRVGTCCRGCGRPT